VTVFEYIDDKDIAEKWYTQLLEKQLFFQESLMNIDEELAMINRLEVVCGHIFA
jgi:hypothetical protein